MKIKWLGHACFLITSDNGVRIVTDPFDDTVGYELPAVRADIVASSHNHFDHNNTGVIKGSFELFDQPGASAARRRRLGVRANVIQTS